MHQRDVLKKYSMKIELKKHKFVLRDKILFHQKFH